MKKLIVLIAALLAALFVVGCASKGPTGPAAADLMADAKGGAPAGTLVGQATAQGTKDSSAKSKAEQNAVNQIKRGLNSIAMNLIDAQVAAGRVSSSVQNEFKQNVTKAFDSVSVGGAQKVDSGADVTGRGWAVFVVDKASALQAITAAADAAKTVVPAGNFTPSSGFDAAFDRAAAMEWK